MELVILLAVAFVAGFIDSIAGGGGLVQVPGLIAVLGRNPLADVFGTNKGSSIAGTAVATIQFARAGSMPWREVAPAAIVSLPAAYAGAATVSAMSPATLGPIVLAMLFGVFVFTLAKPKLGEAGAPIEARVALRRSLVLGVALGFYDGFFGPGTGTFLVFGFVRGMGLDFLRATAAAKLVNLATNLAALTLFAMHGQVRWELALPMAVANIGGALIGTRLAVKQGAPLVRKAFVVVVVALLAKVGFDLIRH